MHEQAKRIEAQDVPSLDHERLDAYQVAPTTLPAPHCDVRRVAVADWRTSSAERPGPSA